MDGSKSSQNVCKLSAFGVRCKRPTFERVRSVRRLYRIIDNSHPASSALVLRARMILISIFGSPNRPKALERKKCPSQCRQLWRQTTLSSFSRPLLCPMELWYPTGS